MAKQLQMTREMLDAVLRPRKTWGRQFMRIAFLAQPREDYWPDRGHIMDLRNQFAAVGQIQAVEIVRYSSVEGMARHLSVLTCYGEQRSANELGPDRQGRYAAVSFGHCRTLAHRALWLFGCDECLHRHGAEKPGVCYRRHIEAIGLKYRVGYNDDPDPISVINRQFGENTAKRVAAINEAKTIYGRWLLEQELNPSITRERFARDVVARSQEVVDRALGFSQAPVAVQDAVASDDVTFTVAAELGRYYVILMDQASLPGADSEAVRKRAEYLVAEHWLQRAMVRRPAQSLECQQARVDQQRLPADTFLRAMRTEIEQAARSQGSMFAELTPEEARRLLQERESEAAYTMTGTLRAATRVLTALNGRVEARTLGQIAPLASTETQRELTRFIEELRKFVPHLPEALAGQAAALVGEFDAADPHKQEGTLSLLAA